jgi:flagellar hook protein FlgE
VIASNHVSYCRLGGIRVEGGGIRNLQITGNDIEYNNNRSIGVADADAEPTAEILIDCRTGTIREGTIASNTLEASTVDLAQEFTNMIRFQRAYSAASKIVTTVDEMLQEVSNLKR